MSPQIVVRENLRLRAMDMYTSIALFNYSICKKCINFVEKYEITPALEFYSPFYYCFTVTNTEDLQQHVLQP